MFVQNQLSHWIDGIRQQLTLPLRIELWNGQQVDLSSETPRVTIKLPNVAAARYLLTPSLSNLGAAYVEGAIEVRGKAKDMIAVVNALARTSLKAEGKFARMVRSFTHSKQKDAEAIRYHYDVSNDFYQEFLDPHMVYSCAYFENGDEDLATAQLKKIDHILRKIELQPGQTLLDIGCGWGALVIRAAQQYKARCVGVTLSENQYALARQRVREAGLAHLVEIRLQDYRDVQGQFDRITSVGMFEHVGLKHLPEYFGAINRLLAPDGIVMNHGITSTDPNNGETPYGGGEFIEKYVFPHGELAHIGNVLKAMQQGTLEVTDVENLRRHYARTCAIWTDNFEAHGERVRELAGDRRYRIWHVYLAGCSYAFEQDWISLYQIVGRKAGQRSAVLPWSRQHMYPQASAGGWQISS
ncbi:MULTISPECIES: cyclopropane-fatty-acyl-phospholipid synthase family protein [unclassified Duganella]|uniref:SAM-dependent methyltransferase n=1 Tax=unclassified Duganella TaxID=2636909 RepID=UPI0008830942|nr:MULTISPECIES: cyclopropane-fatty-acyl-phospholipid synthase family protein [unclassified Duganella]SDG22360.1 cyclopropane-fatty-acyl-phospholipid synthase [Duganella sp. OV458]SDJ26041.1 cyclopropane-fatty-acyl-phospholipid synthase [Duganella sp. OV510]